MHNRGWQGSEDLTIWPKAFIHAPNHHDMIPLSVSHSMLIHVLVQLCSHEFKTEVRVEIMLDMVTFEQQLISRIQLRLLMIPEGVELAKDFFLHFALATTDDFIVAFFVLPDAQYTCSVTYT